MAVGDKAIRGMIINPKAGLALAFHFNPRVIDHEKETIYDIDTPPAFNAPIVTWVSGGEYRIRFALTFDYTQGAVDSDIIKVISPIGARGAIAVLESFLRPEKKLKSFLNSKTKVQKPPPLCYLVLGPRFWLTRLLTAPVKEILHDITLTPLRIFSKLEFIVIEEGAINNINQGARKGAALIESSFGILNSTLTVF